MLFCMGAVALFGGMLALYENIECWYYGIEATMELADTSKPLPRPSPGEDIYLLDLKYKSKEAELTVPRQWMDGDIARRLGDGEKIQMIYYSNNPKKVLYSTEELESPWLWLLIGGALMATFRYALKLLHRCDPVEHV